MAIPLATAFGIGSSLFGIGKGIFGGIKARRLERNNIRPTATVNSNIVKNVGDAAIAAQTGLSDRVYNNALTQLNTGLNAGARQIGRMGGTASVASTLQAFNQGVNNLAAQDQQAQQANQRQLFGARTALANEQQRVWDWNEARRYQETAQRVAQLRNASQQNVFNGLTTLSSQLQGIGDSDESSEGNPLALQNANASLRGQLFDNSIAKPFQTGIYKNPYQFGSTIRQTLIR